ncbi:ATP synthase F0 subunit A [Candidatus Roizmanbacteria bacterium CG22_combo_CG10-13_8_21_14_all_38_20]|uniref:ATP synthase subunit a n=1 Tax=Candidatus Roizmanbacteria bacterium CG22_combo_CG10-13_8_21_14_all_38_20 TaxID=1974862 RepID=A0A2H0BUK4_9BACT|nr:F0F1 ATP synthase subunit A [Candidatus Microgenomates bacterium]PIP61365.1 MAG: ATP synthase F0 subunit A [Candidatus Roizmanbacteria bacterium CG22_combo_CG10-13_8_21_14_all_38_20]PJC31475.1 MAG: ATP synthase F0 subunit A [Candidatus Roizmanbacteria bacterium CG_4_9_14_0_2_um_filter_38_17]
MEKEIHISLPAQTLFHIGGLPVTNTLLITWVVMFFLIVFSYRVSRNLKNKPGKLQMVVEIVIGGIYGLFEKITGHNTAKFFPLLATIFLIVLFSNWTGLLPGMESIFTTVIEHGHEIHIPILRAPSTDLNFTLALAISAVVFIQFFGLRNLGINYLSKFIDFKNPINFFVGILEIISEFAKVVSFAFRLFGNIFAGEVLLIVIASLAPLLAPLPFLALELFVGFIQAIVFSMLTAVFLNVAVSKH